MAHIDRHLRIPGNEPTEIPSVKMLDRRYVRALSNAAQNPTFHNSTITQRLHAAREGELLLIDEEFEGLDVGTDLSVYFTTEHDSQKVLGATRQESSKGVRFGQLLFEGVRNAFAQEYVAAKATSVEAAVSEAAAARFVNQRTAETGMQTYSPIGFLKTAPQRVQLLTRYVGNTLTFDNVLWNESGGVTENQVADALSKSAVSLATLHAGYRLSHGDAQPKNMAWDHVSNGPWAVDLEDATRHIKGADWDFENSVKMDLFELMLVQPKKRSEDMFELVAQKYIDHYRGISSNLSPIPVSKDEIMRMRNEKLRRLPRVT
jgi:hypothetical protein